MSATACCDGPFDNHILYKSLYLKTPPERSVRCKRLLNFSDSVISLFLVGPLVIAYWRGTQQHLLYLHFFFFFFSSSSPEHSSANLPHATLVPLFTSSVLSALTLKPK
jgi:hypothetical protein